MKREGKIIALVIAVVMLACMTAACGDAADKGDSMFGTWKLYGVVEAGTDIEKVSEEDIITGKEYRSNFGVEVPNETITLTADGIKEMNDVPGTEVESWEKTNNHQYKLKIKLIELSGGEAPKEPMEQEMTFTLHEGLLFVETKDIPEDVDDDATTNINVYKRD